jgi:Mg-chelatase subunit ChlD
MPDRGVDRPPFPDEVHEAKRLAQRLLRARRLGRRRIDKRTPGGRFDGRAYARARFERATGRPVTSHPWTITREITAPLEEPHALLVVDTSGSMHAHEYALGPIVWIVTTAFRTIGGRTTTVLFGNAAALLSDGNDPMPKVPAIRVGGGTAFAGDAIAIGAEHLDMENQRRPRAVYVLSDGGWFDTETGVRKIRWLADLGVPTIHLSIGAEPLAVEAGRICVLTDPADGLDVIAQHTVEALNAARPARPAA